MNDRAALERDAARRFAAVFDRRLKPYQSELIQAAGRPAETGPGYAASQVSILLPRQVGKTMSVFMLAMARMQLRPEFCAAYTAQSGTNATHIFTNAKDGWITLIESSPAMAARWRTTRSMGREVIASKGNRGAYLKAFPPTPGRLRSHALDLVVLDECQEHSTETGQVLMGDIGPVFTTRPRRQLILCGTAGDNPGWWNDRVLDARDGRGLLLEVGTWPEEADPEDPRTWREHHPGLIHGLTDETHLAAQLQSLGPAMFAREYGNRFTGAGQLGDNPIPDALWLAARWEGDPPAEPAAIGFDTAGDGSASCIIAVGRSPDGRAVAGVVATGPGTSWLPARIADLHTRHPRARLIGDPVGPAGAALEQLAQDRVAVEHFTGEARIIAHGHLLAQLEAGRAFVMPHPALDAARAGGVRRFTDGGGWVWSRRRSTADTSPLTAWTMALWAARKPPSARPQVVVSPGRPRNSGGSR